MESTVNTTMCATVLTVMDERLLVCDHLTSQEVIVHTRNACRFCAGDQICIRFSGAMTLSLPPQISAISITKTPSCR